MQNLKFHLATVVLLGVNVASAADIAPRYYAKAPPLMTAAYDWSGFYIGANGGWGSGNSCWSVNSRLPGFPGGPSIPAAEGCHTATGGTAGGHIGYRAQTGRFVFGLEAQGNWADITGSSQSSFFGGIRNQSRTDGFGLFAGQAGYAWNNALLYVKGGTAFTGDTYTGYNIAAGNAFDRGSVTRVGAVAGAGLEFGFTRNWSAAIEYDHLFMDERIVAFTIPGGVFSREDQIRQDIDLVTLRLNYRFGGPMVARY